MSVASAGVGRHVCGGTAAGLDMKGGTAACLSANGDETFNKELKKEKEKDTKTTITHMGATRRRHVTSGDAPFDHVD